jgi:hypothetical protein
MATNVYETALGKLGKKVHFENKHYLNKPVLTQHTESGELILGGFGTLNPASVDTATGGC